MSLYNTSDVEILRIVGEQLKRIRLNKNMTQQQVADKAGLDRTTVNEIENQGRAITLLSFVQILRALDKLDLLNVFMTEPEISPMQMAKLQGKQRKRAHPGKTETKEKGSSW